MGKKPSPSAALCSGAQIGQPFMHSREKEERDGPVRAYTGPQSKAWRCLASTRLDHWSIQAGPAPEIVRPNEEI